MRAHNFLTRFAVLWACTCAAAGAFAQDMRDPTRPPAAASGAGSADGAPALPITPGSTTVVQREGQPYLVVGTRLVALGQSVGGFRLERITETEIWLRQGKGLYKVARFGGIERSAAAECQRAPAPSAASAKTGNSKTTGKPPSKTAASNPPNAAPCESSSP